MWYSCKIDSYINNNYNDGCWDDDYNDDNDDDIHDDNSQDDDDEVMMITEFHVLDLTSKALCCQMALTCTLTRETLQCKLAWCISGMQQPYCGRKQFSYWFWRSWNRFDEWNCEPFRIWFLQVHPFLSLFHFTAQLVVHWAFWLIQHCRLDSPLNCRVKVIFFLWSSHWFWLHSQLLFQMSKTRDVLCND